MSQPKPPTPNPAKDYKKSLQVYLKYLPQLLEGEQAARTKYDPARIEEQQALQEKYGPKMYEQQLAALQQLDPQGVAIRKQLGDTVTGNLTAANRGVLPPGLEDAWTAMARGSAVAHGNEVGAAPQAFENIFKAQNLLGYQQQQMTNAGAFLAGPTPEQQLTLVQPVAPDRASAYVNPSAPGQMAAPNYQNVLAAWQASGAGRNPWAGALGGAIGGATAGATFGPYGAVGGALIGGVGGYFCNLHLKKDLRKIGERNGLDIYEFRYHWGTDRYRGVIAEDVKRIYPHAVTPVGDRLLVDYNAIGVPFEKQCVRCQQFKSINVFYARKGGKDGHRSDCKKCNNDRRQEWNRANPEKYKQQRRRSEKAYFLRHPERIRAKDRRRQPRKTAYMRRRRQTVPTFRLASILRTALCNRLKERGGTKGESAVTLLGCSVEEFKQHLQSKFKPGMNWSNYGSWHIDHIRPCISFDLTDPIQQRLCFHYSNMQPLWSTENQIKHAKLKWEVN